MGYIVTYTYSPTGKQAGHVPDRRYHQVEIGG